MTITEFREELKRLYREFPRPQRETETVGDWARRLFEHQVTVSKCITDFFAYDFPYEAGQEPPPDVPTESVSCQGVADAINYSLRQERYRIHQAGKLRPDGAP